MEIKSTSQKENKVVRVYARQANLMCSAGGCLKPAKTRSLCQHHYDEVRRPDRVKRWAETLKESSKIQINAGLCVRYKCPNSPLPAHRMCEKHRIQRMSSHTPELSTVSTHIRLIHRNVSTYASMPFFDEWDPKHGGSYRAGEDWIVRHIGRRPAKGYDLHIVDRSIGFMPGNLEWVPRDMHRRKEFINQLLLRVHTLENRLRFYET
jgi:hypothetical protein